MKVVVKTEDLTSLLYRKGWTRRQLAEQAQINEATAQKVVKGQRSPSPPVAKKIVDALGVKFEDIFELETVSRSIRGHRG
ncbi:helix-turn-helix protein [compost metagenome]